MPSNNPQGLLHFASPHSVCETIDRLEAALQANGIQVFCRIDHSAEAARAGLSMRDCQLLIFGSPQVGTQIMQAAPTSAIDLPLKALAWKDKRDCVWLTINSPEYLQERHGFSREMMRKIADLWPVIQQAA